MSIDIEIDIPSPAEQRRRAAERAARLGLDQKVRQRLRKQSNLAYAISQMPATFEGDGGQSAGCESLLDDRGRPRDGSKVIKAYVPRGNQQKPGRKPKPEEEKGAPIPTNGMHRLTLECQIEALCQDLVLSDAKRFRVLCKNVSWDGKDLEGLKRKLLVLKNSSIKDGKKLTEPV